MFGRTAASAPSAGCCAAMAPVGRPDTRERAPRPATALEDCVKNDRRLTDRLSDMIALLSPESFELFDFARSLRDIQTRLVQKRVLRTVGIKREPPIFVWPEDLDCFELACFGMPSSEGHAVAEVELMLGSVNRPDGQLDSIAIQEFVNLTGLFRVVEVAPRVDHLNKPRDEAAGESRLPAENDDLRMAPRQHQADGVGEWRGMISDRKRLPAGLFVDFIDLVVFAR